MREYSFSVTVTADSEAHAIQVMAERVERDEDYGFPYSITGWMMEEA